jgi:hypothetical protein
LKNPQMQIIGETIMMSIQPPTLTRAQRYALGKVAMRSIDGNTTLAERYPKYSAAFEFLAQHTLIEAVPAGGYILTANGAREIQTWMPSARPVSHSALSDYIHDYNNASLYGDAS